MNGFNRLVRRGHTYYVRARVPKGIAYLIKTTQLFYSLRTNSYAQAIEKLGREHIKIDIKFNLLKNIDMRIKNQHLILDDTDLDKLVVYKLKELERTFENFYDEIASRDIGFDKVSLFADSQNELEAANNLMSGYPFCQITWHSVYTFSF